MSNRIYTICYNFPSMKSARLFAAVFVLQVIALAQQTSSLRLEINGDVAKPIVYEEAQWKQLRHFSLSATNLHDKKTATYSGVRLLDLFKEAGVPNAENLLGKTLASCIVVIAADGYQVVFSLAELAESIGNEQLLLADAQDAKALSPDTGPLRLSVPGDERPARCARMLRPSGEVTHPP